jgi:hypothetical protein
MSALDDLDRAIAAEYDRLAQCQTTGCQDDHLDLVNDYRRARTTLASDNPDPEDKRHALAILHTARTATGGTP